MFACLCGGVVEFSIIGLVGLIIAAVNFVVNWYNRRKCAKHNCRHKCGK